VTIRVTPDKKLPSKLTKTAPGASRVPAHQNPAHKKHPAFTHGHTRSTHPSHIPSRDPYCVTACKHYGGTLGTTGAM